MVLYVNADWSAIVPAGSTAAAFGIDVKTAKRLGLLPLEDDEVSEEPEIRTTANVAEPEVKEAPKAANKAAKKPLNK